MTFTGYSNEIWVLGKNHENPINPETHLISSLKMSQTSVQSILIKYFFPRYFENFTQKDNRRNASNRRTISTSGLKQEGKAVR